MHGCPVARKIKERHRVLKYLRLLKFGIFVSQHFQFHFYGGFSLCFSFYYGGIFPVYRKVYMIRQILYAELTNVNIDSLSCLL